MILKSIASLSLLLVSSKPFTPKHRNLSSVMFAFRTYTHTVNTQTNLLQDFFCVEIFSLVVVGHIFFLAQVIEITHHRKVSRFFCVVIGCIGYGESCVQLHKQNFDCIKLCVREILVGSEKVNVL